MGPVARQALRSSVCPMRARRSARRARQETGLPSLSMRAQELEATRVPPTTARPVPERERTPAMAHSMTVPAPLVRPTRGRAPGRVAGRQEAAQPARPRSGLERRLHWKAARAVHATTAMRPVTKPRETQGNPKCRRLGWLARAHRPIRGMEATRSWERPG
jgi:hypothetical protein